MNMYHGIAIFSGNAHPELADEICLHLGTTCGQAEVFTFSNENIFVKIDENIRGKDVYVIQPLTSPVSHHILELLIILDALKRASAGRITAVIPYYAYGRTDKKDQPRVPITARLLADLIVTSGANRVLTMDLHAGQIQGFFNIQVDELTAKQVLAGYWLSKNISDLTVVSTDIGYAKSARDFAELLGAPLAIVGKRRIGNGEATEQFALIGEVRDRNVLIVDDEIDTAGSISQAADLMRQQGALDIYACATHAVLSGPAIERLARSSIAELAITNTIPLPPQKHLPNTVVLSVADLFARAITCIHNNQSISRLFSEPVHMAAPIARRH